MLQAIVMRNLAISVNSKKEEADRKALEKAYSLDTARKQTEEALQRIQEIAEKGLFYFYCESAINRIAQENLRDHGFVVQVLGSGGVKISW